MVARRLTRTVWVLLALALLDQLVLRVLVRDDHLFGWPLVPYYPMELDQRPLSDFGLELDSELGWRLAQDTVELDWSGGRLGTKPLAPRKQTGGLRILVLGGSVTLGAELSLAETFCARLDAEHDACEVINLSTPWHGIDQSLLRLRQRGLALEPDEVWLAFEPEVALIATTRFVPLVRRDSREPLFKPRFALQENDELQLLPIPATTSAAMSSLLADEERYREEFAPTELWASTRGSLAIPGLGEQFLATRLLGTLAVQHRLDDDARLAQPSSEAFRTLVAVARAFEREVTGAGIRLRILILPDLTVEPARVSARPRGPEQFRDELRSYGLEVLDLSGLFQSVERPTRWSAAEHRSVADALEAVLRD